MKTIVNMHGRVGTKKYFSVIEKEITPEKMFEKPPEDLFLEATGVKPDAGTLVIDIRVEQPLFGGIVRTGFETNDLGKAIAEGQRIEKLCQEKDGEYELLPPPDVLFMIGVQAYIIGDKVSFHGVAELLAHIGKDMNIFPHEISQKDLAGFMKRVLISIAQDQGMGMDKRAAH